MAVVEIRPTAILANVGVEVIERNVTVVKETHTESTDTSYVLPLVVTIIILMLAILILICCLIKRRRRKQEEKDRALEAGSGLQASTHDSFDAKKPSLRLNFADLQSMRKKKGKYRLSAKHDTIPEAANEFSNLGTVLAQHACDGTRTPPSPSSSQGEAIYMTAANGTAVDNDAAARKRERDSTYNFADHRKSMGLAARRPSPLHSIYDVAAHRRGGAGLTAPTPAERRRQARQASYLAPQMQARAEDRTVYDVATAPTHVRQSPEYLQAPGKAGAVYCLGRAEHDASDAEYQVISSDCDGDGDVTDDEYDGGDHSRRLSTASTKCSFTEPTYDLGNNVRDVPQQGASSIYDVADQPANGIYDIAQSNNTGQSSGWSSQHSTGSGGPTYDLSDNVRITPGARQGRSGVYDIASGPQPGRTSTDVDVDADVDPDTMTDLYRSLSSKYMDVGMDMGTMDLDMSSLRQLADLNAQLESDPEYIKTGQGGAKNSAGVEWDDSVMALLSRRISSDMVYPMASLETTSSSETSDAYHGTRTRPRKASKASPQKLLEDALAASSTDDDTRRRTKSVRV